jgi:energy-coupling factor transporter transmembrane protein EcfT
MVHYLLVAMLILVCAAAWVGGGWYAYQYIRRWFNWPKWLVFILCLGGFVTGFIVMMDEFHHTSMGGDNTRGWKDDPESGTHILSHRDIRKLQNEGRLEVVKPQDSEPNGNHA